jgi:hypothetical protein
LPFEASDNAQQNLLEPGSAVLQRGDFLQRGPLGSFKTSTEFIRLAVLMYRVKPFDHSLGM